MKVFRLRIKPPSLFLAIFMLIISSPFQSVFAAMVDTETMLEASRGQEARDHLRRLLSREDVRNALVAQGIEPGEAKARIDSLSDTEAAYMADKLDQLPAGGDFLTTLLIVSLIVFIILLITDIAGLTHIFPFVKHSR